MRLHTSLTKDQLFAAMFAAKVAKLIPGHVYFETLEEHKSRSRARSFDVKLAANFKLPGDKRRPVNSGQYGAGDYYSATYDEWGFVIAQIFERDPEAVFGPYKSREDFHEQTHGGYEVF